MARTTVYNDITSKEKLNQCNPENLQIIKEFIEYKDSEGKSDKTIVVYKNASEIICIFFLEKCANKSFLKINKRDVIQFFAWLQNDLKVSSSRIAFMRSTLSGICDYIENIMEVEGFRNNVLKIKTAPKSAVRDKTIIEEDKIIEMMNFYKNKEDYLTMIILALAVSSGLRKSELLEIKMSTFDEQNIKGKFYVTPQPIKVKGRGKNAKATKFIIKDMFDEYLKIWEEYRIKNNISNEYLIANEKGRLNIKQLDYIASKVSKDFDISFYFHSLRHATCTILYKKGNDLNKIKVILGHKDISTTSIYNDTDDSEELEGLNI